MAAKLSFKRLRFSVPFADVSVLEWIELQGNLSYSIRALIKAYIKEHGMTDPTCDLVAEPGARVGRPTLQEAKQKAAYGQETKEQEVPQESIVQEPIVETKEPEKPVYQKPVIPPQTRPKVAMSFPMVDGTGSGLQGTTVGAVQAPAPAAEEPLMDMTAFMAGGNR